jgi:hypothetical protein
VGGHEGHEGQHLPAVAAAMVVLARLGRGAAQPDATAVRLAEDSSGAGAMSGVVVVFILGCVLAAGVGADTGAELVGVSGRGSPSAEVTATDWQGASSRQQADQASRAVGQCRRVAVSQSGSVQDGAWAKNSSSGRAKGATIGREMTPSPKIDDDCGRPAKPHVAKPTLCAATVGCRGGLPLSPRARYSMPLRDMATDSCRRYTSVCAVPECISSHPIPSHPISSRPGVSCPIQPTCRLHARTLASTATWQ